MWQETAKNPTEDTTGQDEDGDDHREPRVKYLEDFVQKDSDKSLEWPFSNLRLSKTPLKSWKKASVPDQDGHQTDPQGSSGEDDSGAG